MLSARRAQAGQTLAYVLRNRDAKVLWRRWMNGEKGGSEEESEDQLEGKGEVHSIKFSVAIVSFLSVL